MRARWWIACAFALSACGDDIAPTPIFTIAGQPFAPVLIVSRAGTGPPDGIENPNPVGFVDVYMSAAGGTLCDETPYRAWHRNTRRADVRLYDGAINAFPSLIATYYVVQPANSTVYYARFFVEDSDANCNVTTVARAVTGTITVATLTNNIPAVTLDVVLDTGEHLTTHVRSEWNCTNTIPFPGPPTPACLD